MENNGEQWERMSQVNEFMTQGRNFAQQLQFQLNSPSSSSQETREILASKILESYQKSLEVLKNSGGETEQDILPSFHGGGSSSPKSEDSDQEQQQVVHSSKKTMPRWTKNVRLSPGAGLEETLDGGFSWRKYGQKDILGAKFPRGYYRCTHRKSQGCMATKQVQRSDSDPSIVDITYRGTHTCWQAAAANASSLTLTNSSSVVQNHQELPNNNTQQLENFRENLRIITEGLNITVYDHDKKHSQSQSQSQSQFHTQQEQLLPLQGNTTPYSSFPTSENVGFFGSNINEYGISTFHGGIMNPNFQNYSESSEVIVPAAGVVSTSASTSNSPTVSRRADFSFENPELNDPNFPFGGSGGLIFPP